MRYFQKLDMLLAERFFPNVIPGAQFLIELCTEKLQAFTKIQAEAIVIAALYPTYSTQIITLQDTQVTCK